jgi:hypothetical protein
VHCRSCGNQLNDQAAICVSCGVPVNTGTAFCQNCGAQTDPNAEMCVKCGVRLAGGGAGAEARSKIAAGLLGIFLGGLGIHRFYLGYNAIGGVMLGVWILGFILSFVCIGLPILIGV